MRLDRRRFLKMSAAGAMALAPMSSRHSSAPKTFTCYIGTYTDGASEGIYRCTFDPAGGSLAMDGVTGGIENPSFLAVDPSGRYLFAVSETDDGEVYGYRIDDQSEALEFINKKSTHGGAPCYVTSDAEGKNVLVANYAGGNIVVLPIGPDGRLSEASDIEQHEGSSIDPQRQDAPHAHSITLDPSHHNAIAADLGLDKLLVYHFDPAGGMLERAGNADVKPGAGPRHFAFHPDGKRAFVINELDSTLTAFDYDPAAGRLTATQKVSTLPPDFEGESYCADIHVGPSGRFVYGSNRGHDSIVVFDTDESGALSPIQYQPTGGKWPRNFGLDPSGTFLLAANQHTDNIVVFAIDDRSGMLEPTGQTLDVPSPVCVRFAQ